MRLRTTCTLWAFVRTSIIDKVWEEELAILLPPPSTIAPLANNGEKPPIPPRKRGLWGIASALGEKAASWTESDKDKTKPTPPVERRLPPPLPPLEVTTPEKPPLPPRPNTPPPLPRRNEGRSRIAAVSSTVSPPAEEIQAAELPATLPAEELLPAKSTTDQTEFGANETKLSVDTSSPIPASSIPPRLHAMSPPPRTQTPSHVPLPESRPVTPNRAVSPSGAPSTPPPVPRRAAARGPRPISTLIDGNSRPGTPASPIVPPVVPVAPTTTTKDYVSILPGAMLAAETVKTEETREETIDDEAPMHAEEPDSTGDEFKPQEEVILTQAVATSNLSGPLAKDVFVDASESVEVPEDLKTIAEDDEENGRESATAIDKPKINGRDFAVNGTELINGLAEEPYQNEDDKEAYVGDATWEERTWKELVRLREDMVWARIGGLR